MNATFACPRCAESARLEVSPQDRSLACPHCHQQLVLPAGTFDGEQLTRCLACPSTDLYIRKDFPQRLGVTLVAVGIIGSCITWGMNLLVPTFAILFATALIDVVLYLVVPDALMCYRCGAQYRSAAGHERHGAFNLETHERYRQMAARMTARKGV